MRTRHLGLGLLSALVLMLAAWTPGAAAAQRVITWNLHSKYITKAQALYGLETLAPLAGPTGLRTWVVLPDGYTANRCYPVLYLLHAAGGPNEWLEAQAAYQHLHAIVVIVGGGLSEYANWLNGGKRRPGWEDFIFNELIPKVSRSFNVCAGRRFHAIAGSSMGGLGALYLASQRPAYFGTAGSFSGLIAITDPLIEAGFGTYHTIWGARGGFYEVGHDPTYLVPNLKHTRVFVYVGNGQPLNSSDATSGIKVIEEAVMRHEASLFLAAAHRAHVQVHYEIHNGIHSQDNWDLDLAHLMAHGLFGRVSNSPATWQYTTTEQHAEAWGYRFDFAKPPSSLEVFSYADGALRASGTGQVSAQTPAGQSFRATLPFTYRNGTVRSGGSKVTVHPPPRLPITLGLRQNPISPGQPLRVFFTAKRLARGSVYQLSAFQASACTATPVARVRSAPPGHVVSFALRAGGGAGHRTNHWCKGYGILNLAVVSARDPARQIGKFAGQTTFTVRWMGHGAVARDRALGAGPRVSR